MARVLIVEDERKLLGLLAELFADQGHHVATAQRAEEAEQALERSAWDLLITDVRLPRRSGIELLQHARQVQPGLQVIVISAYGTVTGAVEAMRLGAYDYLLKPFELERLLLLAERALESSRLAEENQNLRALKDRHIVSASPSMAEVIRVVERIGPTDTTVLILGESGTGKDVLARRVHALGPRSDRAFVRINCPAIPHNLLESEIFGHVRGAFTGADESRKGKVELAHGGTLFLDEVADMPMEQQGKLLQLLESGVFSPVGTAEEQQADVRVIAATNRDLQEAVLQGRFRQDLLYRINVVTLTLPPLRERLEDLPELTEALLGRLSVKLRRPGLALTPEARHVLGLYHWPGNIRELRNVLERAAVLSREPLLGMGGLPGDLRRLVEADGIEPDQDGSFSSAVERFKRSTILAALRATGWRKAEAAERLGLSPRAMSHYVKRFELDQYRGVD